jgi:hypothetical protein
MSRAVWTATVQKAAVYIAFAKAYVPPIPGLSNGSAVGFGSYGTEVKPTCGVSLAVVGKATMQDQLGQDAGTAYFTDELLWCAINGTNINDAFGVSQTPEGGTRLITPEVVPNCLPYCTLTATSEFSQLNRLNRLSTQGRGCQPQNQHCPQHRVQICRQALGLLHGKPSCQLRTYNSSASIPGVLYTFLVFSQMILRVWETSAATRVWVLQTLGHSRSRSSSPLTSSSGPVQQADPTGHALIEKA